MTANNRTAHLVQRRSPRRSSAVTACLAGASIVGVGFLSPAAAAEVEVERQSREVTSTGVFITCADGTDILFESTSQRAYTTWLRDGVPVREHRHLTFHGTLTDGVSVLPYTGVWNRDQDFSTGELRITGGQFRVALPDGGTLVGAGLRDVTADELEFAGSGDRFVVALCDAFAEG